MKDCKQCNDKPSQNTKGDPSPFHPSHFLKIHWGETAGANQRLQQLKLILTALAGVQAGWFDIIILLFITPNINSLVLFESSSISKLNTTQMSVVKLKPWKRSRGPNRGICIFSAAKDQTLDRNGELYVTLTYRWTQAELP